MLLSQVDAVEDDVPVEPVLSPPRKYDSIPPYYLTDGYRFSLLVILFLVM